MHLIEHESDVDSLDFAPDTKLVAALADHVERGRDRRYHCRAEGQIPFGFKSRRVRISAMPRRIVRLRSNWWLQQSDCVVIVGSANSSNSVRLMEVAQEGLGSAAKRIAWMMPASLTRHGLRVWNPWVSPRCLRTGRTGVRCD